MNESLKIKLYSFTMDCKNPYELAQFYEKLLHWEIPFYNEDFACICPPGAKQGEYPGITFQKNPAYLPPVWPDCPGAQQQMAHLDFSVDNLEASVQFAKQCGATVAESQFSNRWTVMLDPAGHPFCLCQINPENTDQSVVS